MAVVTFFTPAVGFLLLITVFALGDHVFGVWKVLVLKQKFDLWEGILRTFSKIAAYTVVIGLFYMLDEKLLNEVSVKLLSTKDVLSKVVTLGLCLHEWSSVNRNFKEVKGVSIYESLMGGISTARKVMEKAGTIKKTLGVIACVMIVGCSPIYRHDRLVDKYPYLHRMDTLEQTLEVDVDIPGVKHDTAFVDREKTDTIYLTKDRLRIKYFKQNDTVFLSGECDSIKEKRQVKIKQVIGYYPEPVKWWQFPLAIFCFNVVSLGIGWFISKKK